MTPEELAAFAEIDVGQYFLTNPAKLRLIVEAAGIRKADRVVEIGAGVGTVARELPECDLTVIETDARTIEILAKVVPQARVIHGDGIDLLRTGRVSCDVLLSNLPWQITEKLVDVLPTLRIRRAVLSASPTTSFDRLADHFQVSLIGSTEGDDFSPPQPGRSHVVQLIARNREA